MFDHALIPETHLNGKYGTSSSGYDGCPGTGFQRSYTVDFQKKMIRLELATRYQLSAINNRSHMAAKNEKTKEAAQQMGLDTEKLKAGN